MTQPSFFLNTQEGEALSFFIYFIKSLTVASATLLRIFETWQLGLFLQTRFQALGGLKEFDSKQGT